MALGPENYHPTRLLEIPARLLYNSAEAKVKLRISAQQHVIGHYTTLSHSWGGLVPVKLTHETLANLQSGIGLADLPRTFADAVKITYKFGIRYLWIDSLCIIQDDEEDWRRESASMAMVYKNSWLNIAATGSQNPSGGCFFTRELAVVEPVVISISWGLDSQQENQQPTESLCIDTELWKSAIDRSPLGGRGWVVQERFLSPRQIHFGSQQLFWECREQTACEILPGGIHARLTGIGTSGHLKAAAKEILDILEVRKTEVSDGSPKRPRSPTLMSCLELYTAWGDVVERYSRCALTFGRDKLIAISGIAKEMRHAVKDEYLAGMWRNQLPDSLLWYISTSTASDNTALGRPRPLRAPTWSWASLDGPIEVLEPFSDEDKQTLVTEIIDVHVDPLTSDTTGEVIDGRIRCFCRLYPATLYENPDYKPTESSAEIRKMLSIRIGNRDFPLGTEMDEPGLVGLGDKLYFMLIRYHKEAGLAKEYAAVMGVEPAKEYAVVMGLLLQPDPKVPGRFERVGRFTQSELDEPNMFGSAWDYEDGLQYVKSHGDGWYSITIV